MLVLIKAKLLSLCGADPCLCAVQHGYGHTLQGRRSPGKLAGAHNSKQLSSVSLEGNSLSLTLV